MTQSVEIRLSGTGGQGLILAGIILAEAAIIDKKNAVQSQSYGPEARGGASKSEVIISDSDIYFPKVTTPDIFLALSQEACEKYIHGVRDRGIVILDSSINIDDNNKFKVYPIPILDTAADRLLKPMVANIIALGALVSLTGIVTKTALEQAVLSRVPKGTEELNKRALEEGYSLTKKF